MDKIREKLLNSNPSLIIGRLPKSTRLLREIHKDFFRNFQSYMRRYEARLRNRKRSQ